MWEDMGADAVLALTNINGTMDMTKNSMEQINQIRYDDLGSAFEGIKRQLETGVLIPMGEQLLPKLTEFSQWISDNMPTIQETVGNVFGGLGDIIEGLCNNFDTLIPILAGVVTGFVAFKVINEIQVIIITITPLVTALTTAMGAGGLAGAIGAIVNPVGLAVTAIGALVAIIVSLYQNNEDVRNMLNGCWESIKECFSSACDFIKDIISKFIAIATAIWMEYGDSISEVFDTAWELVKSIIKGATDFIKDIFNVFSKAFQGDWKGCWEAVKKLVSDVWNNICDAIGKYLDLVIVTIVNIGIGLFKAGQDAFNQLKKGVTEVWEKLMEWFGKVAKDPIGTITKTGSDLFNAGKEIIGKLLEGLKSTWQNIERWFNEKVEWISNKLKFWDDSKAKMNESEVSSKGKYNGSHRNGLTNVPFDGYRAELHKGEMVLTQAQADRYRNQQQPTIINNTFDTSSLESKLDSCINAINRIPKQQKLNANMA